MKKITLSAILLSCTLALLFNQQILAQDSTNKAKINISADIVSTYIWRGIVSDQSPNIQPTMSLGLGNFTLGAWASGNFT